MWEIKKRSRCRVFKRVKQRNIVDMNCCYCRPVQPVTKDRAAAVDVKEVCTGRGREQEEEEEMKFMLEDRKDNVTLKLLHRKPKFLFDSLLEI